MDETRLAQLRDFIVEARKQGGTYDTIRGQLISSGWTDADVNEYLPTAWQRAEAALAPAAAPPPAPVPVQPPSEAAPQSPAAILGQQPAMAPPAYPPPVQPAYPAPAAYPPGYGVANNSGTMGPVPPEVEAMGWSWGGFGLSWIWGLGNRVYIALLALIPCVTLFVGIWLGLQGHKLAWQNRRFESFEQFQETMRVWNLWGIVIFAISVVINIASFIVQTVLEKGNTH